MVGFADDLSITVSGLCPNTLVDLVQPVLNSIVNAGANMGLAFNERKTEVVLFTNKTKALKNLKNLQVNGVPMEYSSGAKYLGVFLDSKLTFKKHLDEKVNKCKKHFFAIKSIIGKKWGTNPQLMKWAYTAIIRPKLTYACHLWAYKLNKSTIEKLHKLNRMACLSIASVHKSTPTAGLEMIYNLMPLDLFIEQVAIKISRRVSNQITPSWSGIGLRLNQRGHLFLNQRIVSELGIDGLPMDKIPKKHSWTKNFKVLNFELHKNDAKENKNSYYCYTDGSKINDTAGLGYQIRNKGNPKFNYSEFLGSNTTVFQAEVTAITRAASFLGHKQVGQKILFRSDSQAAIQAINSNVTHSPLVEECINAINSLGKNNTVTIQWIKAHVGHEGNEAADQNAKNGTEIRRSGPEPFLPVPQAYIDQKIEESFIKKWNKRWVGSKTCRQTKLWFKTSSKKFLGILKKASRQEISKLVQIITGHCNLRKHKKFYNPETNPLCRWCKQEPETPWHIVIECPCFKNIREKTFHEAILHSFTWSPQLLLRFCQESSLWGMLEDQE